MLFDDAMKSIAHKVHSYKFCHVVASPVMLFL
jgi:hypothetical protein